uniref:Uncharacterized protein MANES_10G094400 n=1 Tax=Rhizophora mucronata TaxID=61149 RepID=A0A2P2LLN0_RHIMU
MVGDSSTSGSSCAWNCLFFDSLELGLEKGTLPMKLAPPLGFACVQFGSFRLAKTADAIDRTLLQSISGQDEPIQET